MADAGAGEAPAHVAPIKGEAPNVVGLTPGVASSVAPMGIPVCPTGALGMPSGEVISSGGRGDSSIAHTPSERDPRPFDKTIRSDHADHSAQ
jgi:hypothetical protein